MCPGPHPGVNYGYVSLESQTYHEISVSQSPRVDTLSLFPCLPYVETVGVRVAVDGTVILWAYLVVPAGGCLLLLSSLSWAWMCMSCGHGQALATSASQHLPSWFMVYNLRLLLTYD